MTEEEIENEVNARVDFKMNELLTAFKNIAGTNYGLAWSTMNTKYVYYKEAYDQAIEIFKKEISIPTPSNRMYSDEMRKKKDIAVTRISNYILKHYRTQIRDLQQLNSFLANEIEKTQKF